jgi:hypothetical protein
MPIGNFATYENKNVISFDTMLPMTQEEIKQGIQETIRLQSYDNAVKEAEFEALKQFDCE